MEFLSKPKPAKGITFDGTITGVDGIIQWVIANGLEVNGATATMANGKWVIDLRYFKPVAQGLVPVYKNAKIEKGVHIIINGEDKIYSYADEAAALVDFDQATE